MWLQGLWAGLSYSCGSILWARLLTFGQTSVAISASSDHNPGAANVFRYGSKEQGLITLSGDIAKGAIPVYLYFRYGFNPSLAPIWPIVVASLPVIGHAFPLWFKGHGGKGVAVSFGCLLGLLPHWQPAALFLASLAFLWAIGLKPDYLLTGVAYSLTAIGFWLTQPLWLLVTWLIISSVVWLRLWLSPEPRTKWEVGAWKH